MLKRRRNSGECFTHSNVAAHCFQGSHANPTSYTCQYESLDTVCARRLSYRSFYLASRASGSYRTIRLKRNTT